METIKKTKRNQEHRKTQLNHKYKNNNKSKNNMCVCVCVCVCVKNRGQEKTKENRDILKHTYKQMYLMRLLKRF